jgi:hypothetical protein
MLYLIISSTALLLISMTMLLRANDLGRRPGLKWHVRRIGFVLTGLAPFGIVIHDVLQKHSPSLYEVSFRFGVLLVFMTSPYMPPWWTWFWGEIMPPRTHPPLFGGFHEDRRRLPRSPIA